MKKILFLLVAVAVINCKARPQNELQYWNIAQKEFAETVAKYPAFKTILDAKMKDAQRIWDEAQKISNDEEKGAKMKEANAKLNEMLGQFTQIKYKNQGVESSLKKAGEKRLSKSDDQKRRSAMEQARKALAEIESTLSKAKPANEEEAKSATQKAISSLISAQGDLDRVMKPLLKK